MKQAAAAIPVPAVTGVDDCGNSDGVVRLEASGLQDKLVSVVTLQLPTIGRAYA